MRKNVPYKNVCLREEYCEYKLWRDQELRFNFQTKINKLYASTQAISQVCENITSRFSQASSQELSVKHGNRRLCTVSCNVPPAAMYHPWLLCTIHGCYVPGWYAPSMAVMYLADMYHPWLLCTWLLWTFSVFRNSSGPAYYIFRNSSGFARYFETLVDLIII